MIFSGLAGAALIMLPLAGASAQEISLPIIVPVTGPVALEGTSQRNGALLALTRAPDGIRLRGDVLDTAGAPEGGANALERVASDRRVVAVAAPFFGTQVLPMLSLADEYRIPLIAPSGTGAITERGSNYIFRFFPSDAVTKLAQARYVVEELGRRRIAVLYNNTAYGQSGRAFLNEYVTRMGAQVVHEEGIDLAARDMSPVIAKMRAANPDVVVLQMHGGSLALLMRQFAQANNQVQVVANTMMTMPSTAALLEPAELRGHCAETASYIGRGVTPELDRFIADYTGRFNGFPDSFAVQQYDGIMMVIDAVRAGARTGAQVRERLAAAEYRGLGMTYRSDGRGNMAHSAVVLCFDGTSREPRLVRSYENLGASLNR
jgi:branched-chain amino acid transport system substrate-binding protein